MTKITYNGKTTELADGYIATLPCKDFKMETDVVVEAPEPAESGGAELNIAYGDTAPEDTSKLWVKTAEPSAVKVASKLNMQVGGNASVTGISNKLPVSFWQYISWSQVGSKTYVFGGYNNSSYTSQILCFDTATTQATILGVQLPVQIRQISCVTIEDKIYLFGGSPASSQYVKTIYCFDTKTQTFTTMDKELPFLWGGGFVSYYNSKFYLFAGVQDKVRSSAIVTFDLETGTSSTLPAVFPEPITMIKGAIVGSCAYIFGGYTGTPSRQICKFNFETETLEVLPAKIGIGETNQLSVVHYKNQIFIFYSSSVECFDVHSETCTALAVKLPQTSQAPACAVTENEIYVFGGTRAIADNIYKFSPDLVLLLNSGELQIQSDDNGNKFNLISTDIAQVEIGVVKVYKGNADGIGEIVEASLHNGTSWVTI